MWLVTNNEGRKQLCQTLAHVQLLIATNSQLVWTVKNVSVYTPPNESPNVTLNLETGRVEKKKPIPSAMPLHRSGDTE